jgi:hypothetical protein
MFTFVSAISKFIGPNRYDDISISLKHKNEWKVLLQSSNGS